MLEHFNQLFFLNREICIIKLIEVFHLAKVKYVDNNETFFIDINFISDKPFSEEYSLSLIHLGGTHS